MQLFYFLIVLYKFIIFTDILSSFLIRLINIKKSYIKIIFVLFKGILINKLFIMVIIAKMSQEYVFIYSSYRQNFPNKEF